jgi:heterodisulfide reductase subunit A
MMERIGVFVCHCGLNIAGTVDVKKVAEVLSKYPGVVHAEDYKYMCSDPGQNLVVKAIKDKQLTGVVVAACSPTLHEPTFRKAAERAGLNPYKVEIANIREHCSWVHNDKPTGTAKAIRIVKTMVRKAAGNDPLETIKVEVTKKALVLGGGVAGIQAALDIANSGYPVILVEKDPSIGGHMAQLSETFPTLDCSQCILTPKMVEAGQHPNIKLYTYSQLEEITGYVGNFKAKIRRKASCVDNVPRSAPANRPTANSSGAWPSARPSTPRSPRPCPTSRCWTRPAAPGSLRGPAASARRSARSTPSTTSRRTRS